MKKLNLWVCAIAATAGALLGSIGPTLAHNSQAHARGVYRGTVTAAAWTSAR